MLRDFPAPQVVQAYSWPAIRQGKHVIAIAPEKTGKTLTYLCPLITSLTHQALYKDVGPGNGVSGNIYQYLLHVNICISTRNLV